MSDATPPQAGWYADPENPAGERWWNGSGWSDHKRPSTAAPAVPPPPAAPVVAAATPVEAPAVPVAPAESGFTFGSAAPAGPRPDPYAPPAYSAPAAYSPYAPAPYGAAPSPSATNTFALAGLIVSLAGILISIAAVVGIVLSILGLVEARKREAAGNPNTGRGLAIAGLVVGGTLTVLGAIVVVAYFAFLLNVGYPS